jgi:hypothetical protein
MGIAQEGDELDRRCDYKTRAATMYFLLNTGLVATATVEVTWGRK